MIIKRVGRFKIEVGPPFPIWISVSDIEKNRPTTPDLFFSVTDLKDLQYALECAQDEVKRIEGE